MRHVAIIPKANRKNMPLVSPSDTFVPKYVFANNRTASKPNNMKTKALEGIKYISLSFISNRDVLIKKIEKIIPTTKASNT